jgi:hypothetical protein
MIAADYAVSACFTDPQGIYINLYVPAQVTWRQGGVVCGVSIKTDYPYENAISLSVQVPSPQIFTVNLRIPAWAAGASARINGRGDAAALEPGAFAAIRREWRSGDRLELELPLPLRLQPVDAAHPDTVALLAGPLVLMRVLDGDGPMATTLTRTALLSAQRPSGAAHEWHVRIAGQALKLRPFVDINEERYSAYQDVLAA